MVGGMGMARRCKIGGLVYYSLFFFGRAGNQSWFKCSISRGHKIGGVVNISFLGERVNSLGPKGPHRNSLDPKFPYHNHSPSSIESFYSIPLHT